MKLNLVVGLRLTASVTRVSSACTCVVQTIRNRRSDSLRAG